MKAKAVDLRFGTRVEYSHGDMNGSLRRHFPQAFDIAAKIFTGFETATGDQMPVEVGESQFQQRERLGEWRTVVDDCVDHQGAAEFRMAAHHQVAAFDFGNRSEEHTSELQSLMRISYAVFCLKKKK